MIQENSLHIVIIGLSLSSSWGNGHATTYRSLVKGLHQEGHRVTFLEQSVEWYAANRDLTSSPHCRLLFYEDRQDLMKSHERLIREADLVMVGSYLQDGVEIGNRVVSVAGGLTAFYDIDTPVTLEKLENGDHEYLEPELIPKFDLYLSFSGGGILNLLEQKYGAALARPLYCSVDPDLYHPEPLQVRWTTGYLGTWSEDRQPGLERLLLEMARRRPQERFVVAGPQYPDHIVWPENVERIDHLPPGRHRSFYNRQRFTVNVTRQAMVKAGFSPSVRLFEAAACGVPVISDPWEGLETLFKPGSEILIAESADQVDHYLERYNLEESRKMGERARKRILVEHSSRKRARQLAGYCRELAKQAVRN